MFKLDDNFLVELGLGALPPVEKNKMLAHIYETLEMRVGMKLAEKMSNEQLDEFEAFINNNDEAGALKWLETNFPNYKQVVAEELEKLKSEIKQAAPQIVEQALAESPSQPAVAQQPPAQQLQQAPQAPAQFQPAPQFQQPVQQQQFQPAPQPSSEPLTNTSGVNFAPQGAGQGPTTGQQPPAQFAPQHPAHQPSSEPLTPTNFAPQGASQGSTSGQQPAPPASPQQPWQPQN